MDPEEDYDYEKAPKEAPEKPKKWKNKKGLDAKREQARANLAKGRAIRAENIKKKKEQVEYDIESDSDSSSSSSDSDDDLVISKKKSKKYSSKPEKKHKKEGNVKLERDLAELKDSFLQMVKYQKKTAKHAKAKPKREGTKIVMMQPNTPSPAKKGSGPTPDIMQLYHSIMKK